MSNYILDRFSYDKESGNFCWSSIYRDNEWKEPKDFGYKSSTNKYYIQIDRVKYKLCDLAYLKIYGYIPEVVDVKDGNSNNLSIINLEDISEISSCIELNKENLMKLLHYDLNTGLFKWRINRGHKKRGKIAGGYVKGKPCSITVFGKQIFAHILAILYVEGYLPDESKDEIVDHLDRDKNNNAYKNLRVVSRSINTKNTKKRIDNTSGFTGVYISLNGKIRAKIGSEYLGTFKTIGLAVEARKIKMKEYGYTDNHGDLE